jgi:hypothetical protein
MMDWWRRLTNSIPKRAAGDFQQLMRRMGGEIEAQRVGHYAVQVKSWCESFLRRRLDQDPHDDGKLQAVYRSVSVRYVDNTRFNAVACGRGARNYAGIYGGVPTVLAALSFSTMRVGSVWPELSAPGTDVDLAEAGLLKDVYWMGSVGTDQLQRRPDLQERLFQSPSLSQRARIANDLFTVMSHFLFFHELGHIARGHLDLLVGAGQPMTIFEVTSETGSPDWRTKQWLELDADRFAVTFLLDAFDWKQPWVETSVPEFESEKRYGPREALRLCYLALGLIFSMFDYREEVISDHQGRSHPHPAVRLANSIGRAASFLVQYYDAPKDQCSDIAGQAILDIDRVGRAIGRNLVSYASQDLDAVGVELNAIRAVLKEGDLSSSWNALHRRIGY